MWPLLRSSLWGRARGLREGLCVLTRPAGTQPSDAEPLGVPDVVLRLVTPPYKSISQLQKAGPKEMPKHTDAGPRLEMK